MEFETEYPKVVLIYILPNVSGEHILYFKNVKIKLIRQKKVISSQIQNEIFNVVLIVNDKVRLLIPIVSIKYTQLNMS